MRVDDRGRLQVFRNGLLAAGVPTPERDLDAGPMGTFVDHAVLADLVRHVLLCVHDELHLIRDVFFLDLRRDLRRLAGRELSVHDRAADAKALLTTRLPASVESRAVQEATKYVRHLFLHDSGPVVFDDD